MINLGNRSAETELLDNPAVPFADIKRNMQELNKINRYLGGHRITIEGVKRTLLNHKLSIPITICEIGCGGGDNLQALSDWCNAKAITCAFIGIDIKPECTSYAAEQYPGLNAEWITSDYSQVTFNQQPSIIFSSLFCHHFSDDELVLMLRWMRKNASVGFFINDLHRHPLAYYSIKLLTQVFSRSYLVKNDAPLSVARGFLKREWGRILDAAGFEKYYVSWKWAFRHLIVYKND